MFRAPIRHMCDALFVKHGLKQQNRAVKSVESGPTNYIPSPLGPIARPSLPQRLRGAGSHDEYKWLKKASVTRSGQAALREIIAAERVHLEDSLRDTGPFQFRLRNEILGYSSGGSQASKVASTSPGDEFTKGFEDATAPERLGDYLYYSGRPPGAESIIYYRRRWPLGSDASGPGPEEVIIDQNVVTHELGLTDCQYLMLGQMRISSDQALLAFTVDTVGNEEYTLYFKNLATGEILKDQALPNVVSVVFAEPLVPSTRDGHSTRVVFYTKSDRTKRAHQVYRRILGTPLTEDVLVYEESNPQWFVDVSISKDNRLICLNSNDRVSSEVRILDSSRPFESPQLVHPRETGVQYFVEHNHGRCYIITNADGASNFKVVTTPARDPKKANWCEEIPHRADTKIEDLDMFDNHMMLYLRRNCEPVVECVTIGDKKAAVAVNIPLGTVELFPGANQDFKARHIRLSAASAVEPEVELDYDLTTGEVRKLFQPSVGDAPNMPPFDAKHFVCHREFVPSGDGVKVPVTLVHKDGLHLNGKNPTLLFVYGAYGHNLEANFKLHRLCLLNRGWVLGFVHARGGGELGKQWYEDGKLLHKMNTFRDFVAASQWIISERYSSPKFMAAKGQSAGALALGYVVNNRPELFKAMIMKVPFLDVLGAMSDPNLPLTIQEYPEWGNPNIPEQRAVIQSYCPTANIPAGVVPPAILLSTSTSDPRVPLWQCVKYLSRLRARAQEKPTAEPRDAGIWETFSKNIDYVLGKQGHRMIVSDIDEHAGHFGAAGHSAQTASYSLEVAFLHKALGLKL